jgi:ketosteroid isomerase-like protein
MTDVGAAFKSAIEAKDMDSAVALLAEDAVFHSPIVYAD